MCQLTLSRCSFLSQDLKNILDDENRRDFQSKKHVSLDLKHTRFLENILKNSSSEEEDVNFEEQRKHFQGRKHQSLDPKVTFKLDKDRAGHDSDDEFFRPEVRRIIREKRHDSNSIIIDLKDFQNILKEAEEEVDQEEQDEDEEDLAEQRKNFQAQKSMSTESRRSYRFFEMDDLNKKGENIRNSVPFVRQITEDGKPMLEIYRPTTNPIYIYTQVRTLCCFTLFCFTLVGWLAECSSLRDSHVSHCQSLTQVHTIFMLINRYELREEVCDGQRFNSALQYNPINRTHFYCDSMKSRTGIRYGWCRLVFVTNGLVSSGDTVQYKFI